MIRPSLARAEVPFSLASTFDRSATTVVIRIEFYILRVKKTTRDDDEDETKICGAARERARKRAAAAGKSSLDSTAASSSSSSIEGSFRFEGFAIFSKLIA